MARCKRKSPPPAAASAAVATVASPHGPKAQKFRKLNAVTLNTPKTAHVSKLESAVAALRPCAPKHGLLPCRSAERKKISTHLRNGVEKGGTTEVLYISGMPGTGKTAIVLEVMQQLRKQLSGKFFLVHINAMRLGDPAQVFREVADQLSCSTSNSKAASDLTDMFSTRPADAPVVVMLIDEVDCLVTQTQAVLYKVFGWLGMPNARLVLAAISNTMDLPERLLPRVASRFHIERVDFAPYTKDQLYEILCSRLRGQQAVDAFNDVALRLCAARIAAASGDIRKALQVCRRAVEIRLQNPSSEGPITIADTQAAEQELILANPTAQAIMGLTAKARRFLAAVVIELRRQEADVVELQKVTSRFKKVLRAVSMDCDRGSASGNAVDFVDISESSHQFVQRFEAMGILVKQVQLSSCMDSLDNVPVILLGSMDREDLSKILIQVEEDVAVRELLDGDLPGAEACRIATHASTSEGLRLD